MNNNLILTIYAKRKLRKLKVWLPIENKLKSDDKILQFGLFLSWFINKKLTPDGFGISCMLAIDCLEKGVNLLNQKPIKSNLVGCTPETYTYLRSKIPVIAEAVFPIDFAEGVKAFFNKKPKKCSLS